MSLRKLAAPATIGLAACLALLPGTVSLAQVTPDEEIEVDESIRPSELIVDGETPGLLMLYTGDVIGYIDTCGCKKNPAGGLSRRKWVIDQLEQKFPAAPTLIVDSGNFSDNPTPQGDVKTKALLTAMQQLGYGVINVGERDVKMGYDYFMQRADGIEVPFTSANIVDSETEQPIFPPHVIVEARSADGSATVRVGVIGVARFNPIFLKAGPGGGNMKILHPVEPVKQQVAELRQAGVQAIVLLAALHKDDARRIVREAPGVDFVIGSYGGLYTTEQEKEGSTWLLYSGNQGKRIGETRAFFGADGKVAEQSTLMHFLTRIYPQDEEMQKFVIEAPQRRSVPAASVPAEDRPFVGSAACKSCHESEYGQWHSTAHAEALATLHAQRPQAGAECTGCHVTGADAGGFRDAASTPELANVGCESCHGPGRKHLERTVARYGAIEIDTCTGCHDVENSPEFDYYTYLPRVTHGVRAAR